MKFLLLMILAFILVLSLWATDAKDKISCNNERIETLECQVSRILHPGIVDEKRGGK